AYMRYADDFAAGTTLAQFVQTLDFVTLAAIIVLPVLAIFAIAVLMRRTQDLRLAAASMTQAAIRLHEPESSAAHKVATVGQAVRREVNAIGDGLERARARASELEVMVHNEVNALERSYSENEGRMRQLIEELTSQREAVVTNSDRMREAIAAVHGNLATDAEQIGTAFTERLQLTGSEITRAIEERTRSLTDTFEGRSTDLKVLLEESTDHLDNALTSSTEHLRLALTQHVDQI